MGKNFHFTGPILFYPGQWRAAEGVQAREAGSRARLWALPLPVLRFKMTEWLCASVFLITAAKVVQRTRGKVLEPKHSSRPRVGTQQLLGVRIPTPTSLSIEFKRRNRIHSRWPQTDFSLKTASRWITKQPGKDFANVGLMKLTTTVVHWHLMETTEKGHGRVNHPKRLSSVAQQNGSSLCLSLSWPFLGVPFASQN